MKELFLDHSIKHRGIDYDGFEDFLFTLYGIKEHPYKDVLFNFFDSKRDGLIDFIEMVEAMNIIYKGSTEQKAIFVFEMLDLYNNE